MKPEAAYTVMIITNNLICNQLSRLIFLNQTFKKIYTFFEFKIFKLPFRNDLITFVEANPIQFTNTLWPVFPCVCV